VPILGPRMIRKRLASGYLGSPAAGGCGLVMAEGVAIWKGGRPLNESEGGWDVIGPSAIPFDEASPALKAMQELDGEPSWPIQYGYAVKLRSKG